MRLVVINHITLDGVMQGPARPDEDLRGGFTHGGWAAPYADSVMGEALGRRMGHSDGGLLLGRLSYEDMLSTWNDLGGPNKEALMSAPKYVVSSNPSTSLDWPNSTLVHGDVPAAVTDIKRRGTGDLVIMGSGQLIRSLIPRGLDRRIPAPDLPDSLEPASASSSGMAMQQTFTWLRASPAPRE